MSAFGQTEMVRSDASARIVPQKELERFLFFLLLLSELGERAA
jgi:hypothetical protein